MPGTLPLAPFQTVYLYGPVIRSDLRLALEAADAADAVTLSHFRSTGLRVETKPDLTPVTEADRAAELAVRQVFEKAHPNDAIAGEEFGETGTSKRRWIIDPIDVTVNYMRGVPIWATLIALEDAGDITVGVVSAPAVGHRWWAARGLGAFRNGSPMQVSNVDSIEEATLSFNSLVNHEEHGIGEEAARLSRRCLRTRGYGDFLSFMFLADGGVDIVTEPIAMEWDLAPLDIIVTEAGGRFTDLNGARTIRGGNAVATNGLLHEEVLEALGVRR
ncbi:MAG: inositol monophosphatase family protein [Acidimicrobiia bacterium]